MISKTLFQAKLIKKELLSSSKPTFHLVFEIPSNLTYQPGDSAVIFPKNDPHLFHKTASLAKLSNSSSLENLNITKPSSNLIRYIYSEKKITLTDELLLKESQNHEVWDFLQKHQIAPKELLLTFLPKLRPRFYSISSSQKVFPHELHLTVNLLKYFTSNIERKGVCSSFLCERVKIGESIPMTFFQSPHFHLPAINADIIMVGAGTGVAPFISFLQERFAKKVLNKQWLFFGEQYREKSFYYGPYLQELEKGGFLKLSLAFSRDSDKKIYVQDLLKKEATELQLWLQKGAYFYLCGNAKKMGHDVELALETIMGKEFLSSKQFIKEVY